MRFASRTDWSHELNPLAKALEDRRRRGLPILDLTESNPTRCEFEYASNEILAALSDAESLNYSPDPRGLAAARASIVDYYAACGVRVPENQIFLTSSTSEAYSYVFRLLANPGETVLVPRPSYPLFDFLARLDDVQLLRYSLAYDGEWGIARHTLSSHEAATTRALLLVNPNNPTGSFIHRDELEFVLDFASRNDLALIADEVFADYVLDEADSPSGDTSQFGRADPAGHESTGVPADRSVISRSAASRVASLAAIDEVPTFTLSGLSKICALPQMKLAWIVVNGPAGVLQEALSHLEVIADTYLSVSTPLACALPRLLATRHTMQPQIMDRLRSNLRYLDGQLSRDALVSRLNCEGGWYAVLKLPLIKTDEEWAVELLNQDGVLTHPGHFYDFTSEGYLVISLLPPSNRFEDGVTRILKRVSESA